MLVAAATAASELLKTINIAGPDGVLEIVGEFQLLTGAVAQTSALVEGFWERL
jgi:hypothetical protein